MAPGSPALAVPLPQHIPQACGRVARPVTGLTPTPCPATKATDHLITRKTGQIHPNTPPEAPGEILVHQVNSVLPVTHRGPGTGQKEQKRARHVSECIYSQVIGTDSTGMDTQWDVPALPQSSPVRLGWSAARGSGTCSGCCSPCRCARPCWGRWRTGSIGCPLEVTGAHTSRITDLRL